MNLFLLRHAEAAPAMPDDARPLTPKGFAQIERMARRLDMESFDAIARIEHSPYLRAAQTAEHFKKVSGLRVPLHVLPGITPDDDARATAEAVCRGDKDRLLVGHNPHHETLAGLLLGQGRATVQVAFAKAGMLALERFSPPTKTTPYGYWQLKWFVTPPELIG